MDVNLGMREQVRAVFLRQGLQRVGFTSADPVVDHLSGWVAGGRHAGMEWLARSPARRTDPSALLPGACSVICTAAAYPASDGRGPIAGYARGEDYHRTLKACLRAAVAELSALLPGVRTRVCVDTAPLLERALAARAGLGWIGRSTLLLDERHGPWLLLGEVITDARFPPDEPATDRCGTCTACVEACPTGALDGERTLDARRCLSYWTIEHRGELPHDIARALGQRVFGCDDCLSACPFPAGGARGRTASAPHSGAAAGGPAPFVPRPDLQDPALDELERRAGESFRRHFASTPIERARRGGLLRNLFHARANAAARAGAAEDAGHRPRDARSGRRAPPGGG